MDLYRLECIETGGNGEGKTCENPENEYGDARLGVLPLQSPHFSLQVRHKICCPLRRLVPAAVGIVAQGKHGEERLLRHFHRADSLVRVYQDPVFFNEGNKQYASDSIMLVMKNKTVQKAHLLSNAFITMQQDAKSFNQIKGAEMVAYFDSTSALTRFDALGGAASIFFLAEQNALATVNKVESKMIYATFKDGDIERMYYYKKLETIIKKIDRLLATETTEDIKDWVPEPVFEEKDR